MTIRFYLLYSHPEQKKKVMKTHKCCNLNVLDGNLTYTVYALIR